MIEDTIKERGRSGPKKKKKVNAISGERWKPIKGFENRLEISNRGRLKSSKDSYHGERLLTLGKRKMHRSRPHTNSPPMCVFYTYKPGTRTRCVINIAREVARAFDPIFDEKLTIDHIDGDRMNNDTDNLRSVTIAENNMAFKVKRASATSQYRGVSRFRGKWKAEIKINKLTKYVGVFESEKVAATERDKAAIRAGYPAQALNFM